MTRSQWPGWDRSDPWHRWHAEEPPSLSPGQGQRLGQPERADQEEGLGGDSDEEGGNKAQLPSGKIVSVHD